MQLSLPLQFNINTILLFDIEYDMDNLVQFAALILRRQKDTLFQLQQSVNIYIKQPKSLNPFFTKYTNITNEFLTDYGTTMADAQEQIAAILHELDLSRTVIVSHGLKNDLLVLNKNNLPLTECKYHYCTYNNAKRLLKRDHHLTLTDIAAESGYMLFNAHNAYADVWGTLNVFCYLQEIENENI